MQNYFPGWRAYYNDQAVKIITNDKPGFAIEVPKGNGTIDLVYEKKNVWQSALFLHISTMIFGLSVIYRLIRRKFFRASQK
jgi:uncharacterized membrane protein YfhO